MHYKHIINFIFLQIGTRFNSLLFIVYRNKLPYA